MYIYCDVNTSLLKKLNQILKKGIYINNFTCAFIITGNIIIVYCKIRLLVSDIRFSRSCAIFIFFIFICINLFMIKKD